MPDQRDSPVFNVSVGGPDHGKDRIDLSDTPVQLNAIIFYAQHFGIYPFFWQGQAINGGAPQAVDINAHLEKARNDICEKIPDPFWDGA